MGAVARALLGEVYGRWAAGADTANIVVAQLRERDIADQWTRSVEPPAVRQAHQIRVQIRVMEYHRHPVRRGGDV